MNDYVNLLGAEDVRSAGNTIRSSAETMSRAASTISEALYRHERFLDEWLQRLQTLLEEKTGGK